MSVGCECSVLSGRSLYDGLTTRPEESYRLWCVVVCDLNEEAPAHRGLLRKKTKFLMLNKSVLPDKCIILNSTTYTDRNLRLPNMHLWSPQRQG
jgi:hypothetical protein